MADQQIGPDINTILDAVERGQVESNGMTLDLTPTIDDTSYPWDRQVGEPNDWYQYFFRYYLMLGPRRNIVRAWRSWREQEKGETEDRGTPSPRWHHVAHEWNWKVRAEAYDEYQRVLDAEKWEQRRAAHRESEWKFAVEAMELAITELTTLEDLRQPSTLSANGGTPGRVQGPRQVLKPDQIARFGELASKLGRLAADMATDQTVNVNVQAKLEEVRQRRWEDVQPLLTKVIEGEFEEGPVDEPPATTDNTSD